MKLIKYDFQLRNNDNTFLEYKDKSLNDLLKILNKHLEEKFEADDITITHNSIYNILNNRNTSKFLKIFIKKITKKTYDNNGKVIETIITN